MADQGASLWERFDSATSILVLAPSAEPPDDEACMDLLSPGDPGDRNVLSVTLSQTPDERCDVWRRHFGDATPKRGLIVAANDAARGASADSTDSPVSVMVLQDPVDPVLLVAEISRHLGRWAETPDPTSICFHSLTALLDRFSAPDVVQMIAGLNTTFRSMDVTAHYHLDPGVSDEQASSEIRPLFDVVVEYLPGGGWTVTRSDDDAPLFRNGEPALPTDLGTVSPDIEDLNLSQSFDSVIDLFTAPQRRAVMYYFVSNDEQESHLDELMEWMESVVPKIGDVSWADSRRALEISLLHVHLPKLVEAGVIEFDQETNVVRYRGNPAMETSIEIALSIEDI